MTRGRRRAPAAACAWGLAVVAGASGGPTAPAHAQPPSAPRDTLRDTRPDTTARRPGARRDSTRRDSVRARALAPVRVTGRADDLVGRAATASQGYVGAADLRARPITREGELLETVPGLIVTQHSGEGKANQYFVRGFNLDHGTDFQTRLEGMPVNMPTHGHGQGYTDLNFLVPELVDHLEYRLGNYHASVGDFGSAGAADIQLVRTLDRPFAVAQTGAFGLARAAGGASTALGAGTRYAGTLLLGGELKAYDGPWQRAEGIRKASGLARYAWERGASRFSVLAMGYRNRWNANDQVPDRAVDGGLISSFGQIDSTDGGASQRYSLSGEWRRAGRRSVQAAQLYGVRSTLGLFSNFTYFLDDPANGDQFEQVDRRTVVGANLASATQRQALGAAHVVTVGLQTRADRIGGLGLHRTAAQRRLATVRTDRVTETGTGVYAEAESRWRPWFRSVLGVREDAYTFRVRSDLAANSGDRTAAIASPKASLVFTPSPRAEVYVSGGTGFHSNDARGTTITVDPATGDSARRVDPLVRSRGAEVGLRATTVGGLRSTVSVWALNLDSELLFVGDAGSTAPSAPSRRRGVTFANYYRPRPNVALDADVSFARARFVDADAGTTHVPGALERVVAGGVTWSPSTAGGAGAFATLRARHFGAYPLTEDNAVRARAATLLNAELGYRLGAGLRLRASLLNLADARADDIQYYYASRLRGEASGGVDDVHAHPVEPRQLRVSLGWGL